MSPISRYLSSFDYASWLNLLQPYAVRGAIAMLRVAIDESGSHGGSPVLTVAVCVGSDARWSRFREAWLPYAQKYAAKGGYHAAKATRSDNEILANLIAEIFPSGGFALRIAYADMKAEVPPAFRARFGDEYALSIWVGIRVLSAICDKQGHDWLAYVLEDGHKGVKGTAKVKQLFHAIKQEPPDSPFRYHVFSDTWVGKEELITHPSDLISHEWAKAYGKPEDSEILAKLRGADFLLKDYSRDALADAVRETSHFLKAEKQSRDRERLDKYRKRKGQG
jgi:hypothetical protein